MWKPVPGKNILILLLRRRQWTLGCVVVSSGYKVLFAVDRRAITRQDDGPESMPIKRCGIKFGNLMASLLSQSQIVFKTRGTGDVSWGLILNRSRIDRLRLRFPFVKDKYYYQASLHLSSSLKDRGPKDHQRSRKLQQRISTSFFGDILLSFVSISWLIRHDAFLKYCPHNKQ